MKKINWALVATFSIMAMALVSCNKDITLQEIEQESAGTISVSVDGIMGEYAQGNETKAGLVSTTRVCWSAGDKVYVYDGASCLGELTVSLKDGKDYYAVLTGESISAPQTGTTKLTLVYSNATVSAISDGKVIVDIAAQAGSTTPANIPFVAFGTLDYTSGTPEISGQIADFSLATSLMRLNCSGLEANAAITGAMLTGMSNECVLNITKDGVEIGQGNMGDIDVSFTGVSANAKGTQTLYAAVAKNGTANAQELNVTQIKTYTYSFGRKAREAGKAFNAICPMGEYVNYISLPGEFSVSDTKKVRFSKGNLRYTVSTRTWSFFDEQYQCGPSSYTAGHDTEISLFTWGYDNWSIVPDGEDYNTKQEEEGDLTQAEDWGSQIGDGSTWRTLTTAEWQYLFSYDIYGNNIRKDKFALGVTVCGRTNCVIIAPDNWNIEENHLLPEYTPSEWAAAEAAGLVCLAPVGYRKGDIVNDVGSYAYYWSSTPDSSYNNTYAYGVDFSDLYFTACFSGSRGDGCAVRLVTEIKAE